MPETYNQPVKGLDPALLKYCATERQTTILTLVQKHGSVKEAIKVETEFPWPAETNVYRMIRSIEQRAAKQGYSPEHDMTREAPDGFNVKGVSTYYDSDGMVRGQWVKTSIDRDRQMEIMQAVVDSISEGIRPVDPLPPPVLARESELLNLYTMTDSHIGMLAWGRETGRDWDLDIAEKTLVSCFADMVRRAPDADTAVIAQLGDWLHYDSLTPETPTSGHILDADSRAGKMVAVAARVLEALVDMALTKHNTVKILIAEGNHDMYGSLWLRTMFRRLYRNEPRVEIIESENPYYAMLWGKTMLAWHHGHKMPPGASIAQYISALYRKMWGQAEHCVIHMGDKHHKSMKEMAGCTVEQHGTLAANDAYAVRGGWRSDQYAEAITYHDELGECGRVRTTPAMVGL
jgi:phenylpyruvate tautomerase PptA (4-oxalocrotonate tautomerase family)